MRETSDLKRFFEKSVLKKKLQQSEHFDLYYTFELQQLHFGMLFRKHKSAAILFWN